MKKIISLCFLLLFFLQVRIYAQVGDAYANAATTARATATKTKCPETKAYCLKVAAWCDCMAENGRTGAAKDCGSQPVSPPLCEADMAGGGAANGSLNRSSSPQSQQQQYQQTQLELQGAKNASMNAYQEAINNGQKESTAILGATLSGAQQISDPKGQLIYTGVGLGVSIFTSLAEKKAERLEKEAAAQREQDKREMEARRLRMLIEAKSAFIKEAIDLNKYSISDLVSKSRYAAILLTPDAFTGNEDLVSFTYPILIPPYSDDTYPLKPAIEAKLLAGLDKNMIKNKNIHILYPITDLGKFTNDFVKKMGSGKVISINAELIAFSKTPFQQDGNKDNQTDFWGNSVKKNEEEIKSKPEKKPTDTKKVDNNFWNQ